MITAVLDTTILSNFAHVDQLHLLNATIDIRFVPPEVMTELSDGVATGRLPNVDWSSLSIAELTHSEQAHATQLSESMGDGEAACLALAASRNWLILTDDLKARRLARSMNIPVSGTIGVLLDLVSRQVIALTSAEMFLSMMIAKGYRSPVQSLAEL